MQNHPMKRKKQALSHDDVETILNQGTYGVMALCSDNEPYAVPLNYVYVASDDPDRFGTIYIHCAPYGHKLEFMRANPQASFCVVAKSDVLPDEFACAYRSVIAFGELSIMEGRDAHRELYALGDKFNPGAHEAIEREIESDAAGCLVVKMDVTHAAGKQAKALLS